MTPPQPISTAVERLSLKKKTSVSAAYTMAMLAIILQTDVRSAWKATHMDISPRLSTSVPAIKIPVYSAEIWDKWWVSKKRAYTAKIAPMRTIPCTAWWSISSLKCTLYRRRLITPTPENSQAWQMHSNSPSQSLLSVVTDSASLFVSFVSNSVSEAVSADLAMEISTTQRKSASMMTNSRPLTRSRLIK